MDYALLYLSFRIYGLYGVCKAGQPINAGEKIKIAASKAPAFKAGKAFKDMLN